MCSCVFPVLHYGFTKYVLFMATILCMLVIMTGPPGSQRRAHRNISSRQTGRPSKVSHFIFPLLPYTRSPSHTSSSHTPAPPPPPPPLPTHLLLSHLLHLLLSHLLPHTPAPPPRVQPDYVSLSFPTISSSGPNGAIIHYKCVWEEGRKGVCAISEGGSVCDGRICAIRTGDLCSQQ